MQYQGLCDVPLGHEKAATDVSQQISCLVGFNQDSIKLRFSFNKKGY